MPTLLAHTFRLNNRGFTLVAMIMLIVFVSIAVLGASVFIVERLRDTEIKLAQTSALQLAEAGLHDAIYNYRFTDTSGNGYFSLGQTNIDAENLFVLGGDAADLLMVDTQNAFLFPFFFSNYFLFFLRVQNANTTTPLTIDRMVVTWDTTGNLRNIRINGGSVWSGNIGSPVNADITNFTLNTTPTNYPITWLWFQGSMAGANINIQFVMTDGSTRDVAVLPASNNFNFTVASTGRRSNSIIWRTVEADYNTVTGTITNYNETNTEITP